MQIKPLIPSCKNIIEPACLMTFSNTSTCLVVSVAFPAVRRCLTPPMVTTNHGFLSSWVTQQTQCGNVDYPWLIQVPEGQRINLTLYDFGGTHSKVRPLHYRRGSGGLIGLHFFGFIIVAGTKCQASSSFWWNWGR